MAQARITPKASSDGTIKLAEAPAYAQLAPQERFVEYDAIAQRMQLVAVDAKSNQDLINRIGMLRDNLASAKHNGYANMPAHDEFVTLVNEYNAWVPSQSLHLTPTNATPATVVADPDAPVAPARETTTDDTTTPPPASTTTPVADEERSGTDERLTRLLDRLEGTDGVIERSDAHHVTLNGDGAGNPGLVARVEALENGNVLHSDGTSVSARTVRHESSAEFNYGKILGFALGGLVIGLLLGLLFFLLGAGAFGPIGGAFVGLLFGAIIGIAVGIRERATDTESTTYRT